MFTFSHLPVGDRFEEPLANLLNEQHRTMKELLEQLKLRKSSAKQQQEVDRVKPQSENVPQTLILDPAQRKRLQQQMQQVRLFLVMLLLDHPMAWPEDKVSIFVKVRNRCLDTLWNHRTPGSSHQVGPENLRSWVIMAQARMHISMLIIFRIIDFKES